MHKGKTIHQPHLPGLMVNIAVGSQEDEQNETLLAQVI